MSGVPASECPGSGGWQGLGLLKCLDGGVGQAQVHLRGPVPGNCLVQADFVVVDSVLLGLLGQHDGVVDLVQVGPARTSGCRTRARVSRSDLGSSLGCARGRVRRCAAMNASKRNERNSSAVVGHDRH